MLRVGKHKGKPFGQAAAQDRGYVAWVLREKDLTRNLKQFAKHVKAEHGGILPCGKHKHKFFDEVLVADPEYCEWVLGLKDSELFGQFIEYLKQNFEKPEPPPKKARTEQTCKVCFDKEVNACFVPCGHIACCLACALRFDGKPCPICTQSVALVVQTFVA